MSFLKGKPKDSAEPHEMPFCTAGAQVVPAGDLETWMSSWMGQWQVVPLLWSRRKKKW